MNIITAWQRISPQLIVKGFKKRCKSSIADETDDDMLWNDSEEHVTSECEEDESTGYEDGESDTDW